METYIDQVIEEAENIENKPLFVALKTKFYEQFKYGLKRYELRKLNSNFNAQTCKIGKAVILSKGYGNHERLGCYITSYKEVNGSDLPLNMQKSAREVYGTATLRFAIIGLSKPRKLDSKGNVRPDYLAKFRIWAGR